MKKSEEQIEGQLNIFDFTGEQKPPEFREKPQAPKICDGCLFDNPCIWLSTNSPCIHGANKITEKEGWHRINNTTIPGRTTGIYPTNTSKREPIEVIILSSDNRFEVAAGEGINQALIMPRGTPEGVRVAWRYYERANNETEHTISSEFPD